MQTLGTVFMAVLGVFVVAALISTFFIWLGARIAGIKNARFGNSLLAAIGAAFVTWLISWLFAGAAGIWAIIGFIIGLILSIFVVQGAFKTTFGKALLAWIFHVIAEIIAILIATATFASILLTIVG